MSKSRKPNQKFEQLVQKTVKQTKPAVVVENKNTGVGFPSQYTTDKTKNVRKKRRTKPKIVDDGKSFDYNNPM